MITLTLENFRCWENNTFTFPNHGICLINGRSGRGKSTILNAIYYAIHGKLKNITTFGKKSTRVTLFIENDSQKIKIIRTRNPVRLVVEFQSNTYEDEDAQMVIDRHFGKFFGSTSYIDQENTYSFFSLSSSDKMEFLENLLMEEQSIESIREKIKNQIADSKVQFASIESKISSLVDILNTSPSPSPSPSLSQLTIGENKVTPSNVDLLIEKVSKNLSVIGTNSEISFSKIKKIEENLRAFHIRSQIKEIDSELLDLNEYSSNHHIIVLEKEKNTLFYQREWLKIEQSIEECQKELQEKKSELEEKIKTLGNVDDKNLEKLHQSKKWLEQLFEWDEKMNQSVENKEVEKKWLENEHFHLEKQKEFIYKLELSKKSLKCPSCHISLQWVQDKLEKLDFNLDDSQDIDEKKTEYEREQSIFRKRQKVFDQYLHMEDQYNQLYNRTEKILTSYGLDMDMDCVDQWIARIQMYGESIKKLALLQEDRLLKSLLAKKEELQKKINTHDTHDTYDTSYDTITKKYDTVIEKLAVFKDKYDRYHMLLNKKREWEKNDTKNTNDTNEEKYEHLAEKLEKERQKYREYEDKKDTYRDYLEGLKQWKTNMEQYQKREKIQVQIDTEKERRDDYSDRMKGLIKLRDYVKIAEKKCLEEFIQSLNKHASIYLEHFFQEDDLKVELKSTQELKNGKEKICLNFELICFKNDKKFDFK
jgi:exonuclease SbcC